MAVARSRQDQLQRIVGARGLVHRFVAISDSAHRAAGWYFTPVAAREGCECEFCEAVRNEKPAFVAAGALLAATLLHQYIADHPAPDRHTA
jgi:hypothetical protein